MYTYNFGFSYSTTNIKLDYSLKIIEFELITPTKKLLTKLEMFICLKKAVSLDESAKLYIVNQNNV